MTEPDVLEKKKPVPAFVKVIVALAIVGVIVLVIFIGMQQPDSSTLAGSVEYRIATEELSSGEDIVINIDNINLYIPGNAINLAGSISLFQRKPISSYDADELVWYRPYVVNIEYRNEDGEFISLAMFSRPVEICFKLPRKLWEDYTNRPDEFQVQFLIVEEVPPRWEVLPRISYPERSELCGQLQNSSLFALAVKPQGSIPVTGLNPTPTPAVNNPLQFLSDLFNFDSNDSLDEGTGDVYGP